MRHPLADHIYEKHSEWIEMTARPDELLINLLAAHLKKEIEYTQYLEKRLNYATHNTP